MVSNGKPQATRIKTVAALALAFCISDAASAGAETGDTNAAHATTGDASVVLNAGGPLGRSGDAKGNSVLMAGPSSFWKNTATMRGGGLLVNRGVLRPSPGIAGDRLLTPAVGNEGGITVTGKLLQITAGFTNGPKSSGHLNIGLLRALGGGATPNAAQTFSNVSMIVNDNAGGNIVAPSADVVLIHTVSGVLRVTCGSQSAFDSDATNRAGGLVQSNSVPLLNQSVTNYGAVPVVGPSTAIHSGTLLLSPTGIVTLPNTAPPVDPAR